MPLKGIKVLEFGGLAPAPFCGKILSDFGASVTVIDKLFDNPANVLNNGKRVLALNLKKPKSQVLVTKLAKSYDVLLEPYRPGVMEKLNLGPELLCKENPRLIYARLTGFGQSGRLANRAGHDINYAAISGILSLLGRKNEKPTPPVNILADFAGGGLLCAMGICLALLERHKSGKGQIIDNSMVEGAAYVSSWLLMTQKLPFWSGTERGTNMLDTGAFFYDTYETKDGKYMSVGALEPQFFEKFAEHLGLPDLLQFGLNEECKDSVTKAFLSKTQDEWSMIFEDIDACVYPVVHWKDVMKHDHNKQRESFLQIVDDEIIPKPAPKLSRTPGKIKFSVNVDPVKIAREILFDADMTVNDIRELVEEGVLMLPTSGKL